MAIKNLSLITTLCSLLCSANQLLANPQASQQLGWQVDNQSICQGAFVEPALDLKQLAAHQSQIRADQTDLALESGTSYLRGNVEIAQANKRIQADRASYQLNQQKLTQLDLVGNIRIREPGRLLTARQAHINFLTHQATLHDSFYRFAHGKVSQRYHQRVILNGLNAWGRASRIEQLGKNRYRLRDVSYTTCSPLRTDWQLNARQIDLDTQQGVATAQHATLRWHNIPVLYTPTLRYPIKRRRLSGFLIPSIAYSSQQGMRLSTPFYINLAPWQDMTLTPRFYSSRGMGLSSEYRYLTTRFNGQVNLHYLPDDRHFWAFTRQYPDVSHLNNQRVALHWQQTTALSKHLKHQIDFNTISDNYFIKDFGHSDLNVQHWQLVRRSDLRYASDHWQAQFLFQQFQTIQQRADAKITSTYAQLPQLSFRYEQPQGPLDVTLESAYSHFFWPRPNLFHPDAERLLLHPTLAWPLSTTQFSITPSVAFSLRHYATKNELGLPQNSTLLIPTASLDIRHYQHQSLGSLTGQTEFRVYGLYVPTREQQTVPLFDTQYYPVTYEQLFRDNRFVGQDRIGDARQVSLGIQHHLYGQQGQEFMRIGIGDSLYLTRPKVNLSVGDGSNIVPNAQLTSRVIAFSPLAAELSVFISDRFTLHSDVAYSLDEPGMDNVALSLMANGKRANLHIDYNYQRYLIRLNEKEQLFAEPSHQIGVSSALRLGPRWHLLGTWSYNLTHHYGQTLYLGTRYDSCCWAFTMAAGKALTSVSQDRHPFYNSTVYLQLTLKGLGSIANRRPLSVLADSVSSFNINQ